MLTKPELLRATQHVIREAWRLESSREPNKWCVYNAADMLIGYTWLDQDGTVDVLPLTPFASTGVN